MLRLERTFNKRQLLELYLNEIYLGLGSYGVAAAALNYFDKPLSELSLEEAAYLAALPKAPNNYHPFRKRARALARRNWVLGRMASNGFISDYEERLARAQDLVVTDRPVGVQRVAAEHFAEEVRRRVYDIYGDKKLYGGGLSIRSTLNTDFQTYAQRALRTGLRDYDRRNGYRGPVAKLETLEAWWEEIVKIEPVRFAPVAPGGCVVGGRREASIGLRPRMTRARRFEESVDVGRLTLDSVSWARAAPNAENGYRKIGPKISRVDQVLSVGDIVWVAPADAPGLYGLNKCLR